MAKKKAKAKTDTELSFDTAIVELQSIVAVMEEGTLGLEESLTRYEQGIRLLRACYQKLDAAEQRIEVLTQFRDGEEPETEPFDASATSSTLSSKSGSKAGRRQSKPAADKSASDDDSDSAETDDKSLF